jgi:hypothetical protein
MTLLAIIETTGLTTSDEWITVVFHVIQTYRKEKSRLPKEEMDKSSLRSRNGQKSIAWSRRRRKLRLDSVSIIIYSRNVCLSFFYDDCEN